MSFKLKICANSECNNEFKQYNSLRKHCSYNCAKSSIKKTKNKQYSIPKISKKQSLLLKEYSKLRKEFFKKPENNRCPVYPNLPVVDVHHKMGKIGFADDFARIMDIPLLLDTRFWLGVSRDGHTKIETNPTWAKEMGYSLSRL